MRSTLSEAYLELGWPTAQSLYKQRFQKARASGSRAETRRRSLQASIGCPNRSRSNLRVRNRTRLSVRVCHQRQDDVPRAGEIEDPGAVSAVCWSGYAMGGFLYCRGDRSGRGAQSSSSVHVGRTRPELTPESKERGGRGGRPQWRA